MADQSAKPSTRLADIFAGEGSLADRLRKRRIAIEEGDATGGQSPSAEGTNPPPQQQQQPQQQQPAQTDNSPDAVHERGYSHEGPANYGDTN